MTLISIDRFINIQFPYSDKKFSTKTIIISSVFTWLFAIALGVIPSSLAGIKYAFYDNSHVCIGLPLALLGTFAPTEKSESVIVGGVEFIRTLTEYDQTGNLNGMYFSSAIFLGLNGICYLIILFCYIGIILEVKRSSANTGRRQEMKEQIQLTVRVAAIVATDFCCWFPVILLGMLVQVRVLELPASVFAWLVTFVLPINSAINPYLYTIGAVIRKLREEKEDTAIGNKKTTPGGSDEVKTISSGKSDSSLNIA